MIETCLNYNDKSDICEEAFSFFLFYISTGRIWGCFLEKPHDWEFFGLSGVVFQVTQLIGRPEPVNVGDAGEHCMTRLFPFHLTVCFFNRDGQFI